MYLQVFFFFISSRKHSSVHDARRTNPASHLLNYFCLFRWFLIHPIVF